MCGMAKSKRDGSDWRRRRRSSCRPTFGAPRASVRERRERTDMITEENDRPFDLLINLIETKNRFVETKRSH